MPRESQLEFPLSHRCIFQTSRRSFRAILSVVLFTLVYHPLSAQERDEALNSRFFLRLANLKLHVFLNDREVLNKVFQKNKDCLKERCFEFEEEKQMMKRNNQDIKKFLHIEKKLSQCLRKNNIKPDSQLGILAKFFTHSGFNKNDPCGLPSSSIRRLAEGLLPAFEKGDRWARSGRKIKALHRLEKHKQVFALKNYWQMTSLLNSNFDCQSSPQFSPQWSETQKEACRQFKKLPPILEKKESLEAASKKLNQQIELLNSYIQTYRQSTFDRAKKETEKLLGQGMSPEQLSRRKLVSLSNRDLVSYHAQHWQTLTSRLGQLLTLHGIEEKMSPCTIKDKNTYHFTRFRPILESQKGNVFAYFQKNQKLPPVRVPHNLFCREHPRVSPQELYKAIQKNRQALRKEIQNLQKGSEITQLKRLTMELKRHGQNLYADPSKVNPPLADGKLHDLVDRAYEASLIKHPQQWSQLLYASSKKQRVQLLKDICHHLALLAQDRKRLEGLLTGVSWLTIFSVSSLWTQGLKKGSQTLLQRFPSFFSQAGLLRGYLRYPTIGLGLGLAQSSLLTRPSEANMSNIDPVASSIRVGLQKESRENFLSHFFASTVTGASAAGWARYINRTRQGFLAWNVRRQTKRTASQIGKFEIEEDVSINFAGSVMQALFPLPVVHVNGQEVEVL